MRSLIGPALIALAGVAHADLSDADLSHAKKLREAGLHSTLAYELVASLTTEVGPRLAGSPADARAVAWATRELQRLGFSNVHAEPVPFTAWRRGPAHAEITAPFPQPLVMTALGKSVGTPPEGIEAGIAYYPDIAALRADTSDRARGHIVFIDQKTERRRFNAGYGAAVAARTAGAVEAGKRGAIAVAIRSIGTDHDRLAHTGTMSYKDDVPKIPAIAVSIPDADNIARMVKRGGPVKMRLAVQNETGIAATTHNVIGEIPGTDLASEVVLIGAHLDSWDLGTGAIDDGAGVAIVTAAAKTILDGGVRPRRTIRVVLFGNEEYVVEGAMAYARRHKDERHQVVAESDFGAGRPWRFSTRVLPAALPVVAQIAGVLVPLDISAGDNLAHSGPDADTLREERGWAAFQIDQEGADYFNFHHTANDTLDKIDPATLPPNIAAWAVIAWLAAQSDVEMGPVAPPKGADP